MATEVAVDHSRGLCHKPDTGTSLPREVADISPPNCLCCGFTMKVEDLDSLDMERLGMYRVICPICP